eukprot:maker-scaffold72_size415059-snap-gene-3.17 protein:Tk08678 transcript:maker-scaffold72_size415059-snap-gene-3.17-mRNA-1 annotation:"uncharacterized serine-rich isoform x2"
MCDRKDIENGMKAASQDKIKHLLSVRWNDRHIQTWHDAFHDGVAPAWEVFLKIHEVHGEHKCERLDYTMASSIFVKDDDSAVAASVDEVFLDSTALPFEELGSPLPSPSNASLLVNVNPSIEAEPHQTDQQVNGDKELVARDIKFILDSLKSKSFAKDSVLGRIERLRSQSPGGFKVLMSILRTEHPQFVGMELPNITISSKDFLLPEVGLNEPGPLDFLKMDQDSPDPITSQAQQMLVSSFSEPNSPQWSNMGSPMKENSQSQSGDPSRRARYERTAAILSRSGLLDITMKTAELMQKNRDLNKELFKLKQDTNHFVENVLSNPANRNLVSKSNRVDGKSPTSGDKKPPQVFVSPNLDFHLVSNLGEIQALPTMVSPNNSSVEDGSKSGVKRKADHLSPPSITDP